MSEWVVFVCSVDCCVFSLKLSSGLVDSWAGASCLRDVGSMFGGAASLLSKCVPLAVAAALLPANGVIGTTDGRSLDIWVLPHAHCDVGWLYTVNGYWEYAVRDILNTVVDSLDADPSLRFIWSEVKWIQLWWDEVGDDQKEKMRRIVKSGQFEFVGAGWSQADEVTTTWFDQVDNTLTGQDYLKSIGLSGFCPQKDRCVRVGWQIDMFAGYSGATASLHALNGYDATYMRWAGTDDMFDEWTDEHAFEFVWEPSSSETGLASNKSRGSSNRIFGHIMKHNYGDLAGLANGALRFTWDQDFFPLYELEYVEEEEASYNQQLLSKKHREFGVASHTIKSTPGAAVTDDNVDAYADLFLEFVRDRRDQYQGPILAVWGSDYRFTQASYMYGNMSKIISHINNHPVGVVPVLVCCFALVPLCMLLRCCTLVRSSLCTYPCCRKSMTIQRFATQH